MTTMRPPVHASDPITSHLAALQHEPKRATHCSVVLRAVCNYPGRTIGEYVELINRGKEYDRTEVARRMSDLKTQGHVFRHGRETYNGTSQSLWFPVEPKQGRVL